MASNINEAIIAVMQEVGYVQKERKSGLSYSFAGEAAFIRAVRPVMVENGIFVHPFAVEDISLEGYETAKGKHMNRTVAKFGFRFVHAPSDTSFEVRVLGEGADVGDKDANKAMTAALKYALRQTLLIETGDDPDEQPSHEQERVKGRPYLPEDLKEALHKMAKIAASNEAKAPTQMRNIMAKQLNVLCDGVDDHRHALCNHWWGEPSSKKIAANQVVATMRWMGVESFDDVPSDIVLKEARGTLAHISEKALR